MDDRFLISGTFEKDGVVCVQEFESLEELENAARRQSMQVGGEIHAIERYQTGANWIARWQDGKRIVRKLHKFIID